MNRIRPIPLAAGFVALALACQPLVPSTAPAPSVPSDSTATNAPSGATAGAAPGAPTPGAGAPAQGNAQGGAPGGPGSLPGGAGGEPQPRPYAQVIRGTVITKTGLFRTHQIGSQLYYEIPTAELGKDMLLVTQIAKTNPGDGYGGQAVDNRVVRWERRGHRVLLRSVSYVIVSDPNVPIAEAVRSANYDAILAAFNVATYGPDSAAVIEVSRLFTNPPAEISVIQNHRGTVDGSRSFLERVAAYPQNVEVEATLTLTATPGPSAPFPGLPTTAAAPGAPPVTKSFVLHWSMVRLPEEPMMPRLRDSRVGYFYVSTTDYSRPEQRAQERHFISRWRLEKKDPTAALSDPVKPIEYYVDPATPAWLVPWVKKGIEEWQPAFEAAGFRRAIVARDAPPKSEDPDWSPEDARYSVIRWLPSAIENAVGPSIVDPRSGEILEADVQMYHNIMKSWSWLYWTQVGHLDPRAVRLPFPDSLVGRFVENVVAHEVGHTLGLPHNFAASAMYPADSLHSRTWIARMSHIPTLMDYARLNYVAQPEDSIAVEDFIPKVGVYDRFAIRWGYAPVPGARTADDERPALDAVAREQDETPWLRYGVPDDFGAVLSTANTEAVGDADAVKSTAMGIRNLKRLVPMLVPATTSPTEDVSLTKEGYTRLVGQFVTEMRHVATIPGSSSGQEKYGSQPGPRFTPMPRERQREAVRFVHENLFRTPTWLLDPGILRRLEPDGALTRINTSQRTILTTMMGDDRMARLVEYEAMPGATNTYSLAEYLGDLRAGLWSELSAGAVRTDPFRRGLQRIHLELIAAKLLAPPATAQRLSFTAQTGQSFTAPARQSTDVKAMLRMELRTLDAQLATAQGKAVDAATRAHLADARWQIKEMLEPRR